MDGNVGVHNDSFVQAFHPQGYASMPLGYWTDWNVGYRVDVWSEDQMVDIINCSYRHFPASVINLELTLHCIDPNGASKYSVMCVLL